MQSPKPNSSRSKRRKKRNFSGSRNNRRAKDRLNAKMRAYEEAIKLDTAGGKGYREPGSMKRW